MALRASRAKGADAVASRPADALRLTPFQRRLSVGLLTLGALFALDPLFFSTAYAYWLGPFGCALIVFVATLVISPDDMDRSIGVLGRLRQLFHGNDSAARKGRR